MNKLELAYIIAGYLTRKTRKTDSMQGVWNTIVKLGFWEYLVNIARIDNKESMCKFSKYVDFIILDARLRHKNQNCKLPKKVV